MWLSIIASVITIGISLFFIYFIYLKMNHPDVIFAANRKIHDFIMDSLASLIQGEQLPMFRVRPTMSAGILAYDRFSLLKSNSTEISTKNN
jgi:hypothetical protein